MSRTPVVAEQRQVAISAYQAEQRVAQLAVMARGRANLPKPQDTKPEFDVRLQKCNRRRVFKLIQGDSP